MPTDNSFSERNYELLARLDERTRAIQTDITNIKSDLKETRANIKELDQALKEQKEEMSTGYEAFQKSIEADFVRKESFIPVQRIVYGVVGIIMTAVVIAILGLTLVKP